MNKILKLKILVSALADHIPPDQVSCLNENTIILCGIRITFTGNLASSDRVTFRFTNIKSLLIELFNCGLLNCSGEALVHIQNRYRHIEGKIEPLKNLTP
jgi:hypothetical protein